MLRFPEVVTLYNEALLPEEMFKLFKGTDPTFPLIETDPLPAPITRS